MDAFDHEVDDLEQEFADGLIDRKEFEKRMSDIQYEYHAEAEQAADAAYRNEMSNWYY